MLAEAPPCNCTIERSLESVTSGDGCEEPGSIAPLAYVKSRSTSFAESNQRIACHEGFALARWVPFCIYQVELLSWLPSDAPILRSGLKRLQRAMKPILDGASVVMCS